MFFRKIIIFFYNKKAAKKIKKQLTCWLSQLHIFKIIDIDQPLLLTAEKLRNDCKYEELILSFDDVVRNIKRHNKDVALLKKQFDSIIQKHTIQKILAHIDEYTLANLRSLNDIALKVGKYRIPTSMQNQKVYLSYMRDIGEIINDYPYILEQYSLIRDFDAISFSFGDNYIDEEMAASVLVSARALLEKIKKFGAKYYEIPYLDEKIIERHNEQYIRNHLQDLIFNDVNGKCLDEEQRRAILCDSKSNLTIAGAGAGKTLTICGKVKWLLETKKAREDEILILSYSRASADDLAKKVLGISSRLTVKTFHSFGLEILNYTFGNKRAIEDQFKVYIKKFFDEELGHNSTFINNIFQFFTYYLYSDTDSKHYENEGKKYENLKTSDYCTLKDRLKSLSEDLSNLETIQKEYVKSYEELVIANYLYVNGIAYEYERAYKIDTATPDKRQYTPDFYLPKYDIYLEHYGINIDGKAPQYSRENERNYLNAIEWKRKLHAQNQTICIETYSYEFQNGKIFNNLKNRLLKHGVKFKPLTTNEIINALHSIYAGQEFNSLFNLIVTFINLYKAQYFNEKGFDVLKSYKFTSSYESQRANVFLDICKKIYQYYIKMIRANHKIDFDDMILQSIDAIDKTDKYRYKYVIVDEFQDISQSRTAFLKAIIKHGASKLFAVGDDWQAIYRFAGCDINVFLHFKKYFQDAKLNYITSTHRNSAELQAVVEPFIMANPEQYVKHIRSTKHEKNPVRIIYHDNNRVNAFLKALKNIDQINSSANVLVLGRNRRDIDCMLSREIQLDKQGNLICKQFSQLKLLYKTVHQSKGLESDYVILISAENAKNGFPNKMEDDPLLEMLLENKSSFEFAEERRLFYVALTRTRSIIFILCNKQKPSIFIKEIEERAKIENPELLKNKEEYSCPRCKSGKLLLHVGKGKSRFYSCSNYPYCQYKIYDINAVLKNNRCPDCGDFLVVRNGRYGKFIGCHNYPYCKYTRELKNNKSL